MSKKKATTEAPAKKKRKGDPKKGSAFEREFAKKLSLWWSEGKADDWFWRVGGSGGRATNRAKQGKSTSNGCGDIGAQCHEAQRLLNVVTFELKRGYNSTTIQDVLDKPNGPNQMRDFIEQAKRSASTAGTPYWILVLKRDKREELVVTNMMSGSTAEVKYLMVDYSGHFDFALLEAGSDFWTDGQLKILQEMAKKYENPA
jgi:hypothetical protein